MLETGYEYGWEATHAYIMEGSSPYKWDKYDIGMVIIPDSLPYHKRFFDVTRLSIYKTHKSILGRAKIIPVCLAAKNSNIKNKVFRGVGWGHLYNESPANIQTRNPIYSSCMTNQASPGGRWELTAKENQWDWRFRNCDMQWIKKRSWKCDKVRAPPDYESGEYEKCNEYFEKAGIQLDPLKVPNPMKLEKIPKNYISPSRLLKPRLDKVDKLYIVEETIVEQKPIIVKEVCYNPKLLREAGWCRLVKNPSDDEVEWGICSSSCREAVMKASIFNL